jgi:hypothetical protein
MTSTNPRSEVRGTIRNSAVVPLFIVAGAIAVLLALRSPNTIVFLILINASCATILMQQAAEGARGGVWAPAWWAGLGILGMYVLHPLAMWETGQLENPYHYFFDLRSTYIESIAVSTVASVCLTTAYLVSLRIGSPSGGLNAWTPPTPPSSIRRVTAYGKAATILLCISTVGYGIYSAGAGVTPAQVLASGYGRLSGPGSSAYLYMAPMLLAPTSALYLLRSIAQNKSPAIAHLLMVILVLPSLLSGQRLAVLITALPYLMLLYRVAGRRVGKGRLVALLVLSVILISAMRDIRSDPSATLQRGAFQAVANPQAAFLSLATGADTEMLDGLAVELQVVPRTVPFHPGITVMSLAAAPVPRTIWPNKTKIPEMILDEALFKVAPGNASVAFSFIGGLYLDQGILAVAVGFLGLGLGLGWFTRWISIHGEDELALAAISLSLPLILVLLRGNLPDTGGRALFTAIPLWLLLSRQRSDYSCRTKEIAPSITGS